MRVSIIAAMAENRVIGRDNDLPWRMPADLRHFRRTTLGHHVVMGRKNYESIGKPLPGRTNVVVTGNRDFRAPGCQVVHSIEAALDLARDDPEPFIIGGAALYAQTLPLADRLYLTLIHAEVPGDTVFPEIDARAWRERRRERHEADAENAYAYSFVVLEKTES
ncbi:MAG TPA: type 3 dihydrofolate reductase [Acidiferrobacterales bacterium]|jgi:dihydrofolate reductase